MVAKLFLTASVALAAFASTFGYVVESDLGEPFIQTWSVELDTASADVNILVDAFQSGLCLSEHNSARAANGKGPLTSDARLETAARNHNQVMFNQNCFSHQCPDEQSLGDRVSSTGYQWRGLGENIFSGLRTCPDAVNGWMNSPGHRNNILGDYKHLGCDLLDKYFTCVFGNQ